MPEKHSIEGGKLYPNFGGDKARDRVRRLEKGAQRFQRGVLRPTKGTYARIPVSALDSTHGTLDLRAKGVLTKGSVPPTANTSGFAYTSTTNTIVIYWDGTNGSTPITQKRADKTKQLIPLGNITVTGLTANTTYYSLPYWTPSSPCNVGWVPGTQGTPAILFLQSDLNDPNVGSDANAQQSYQDREPLTVGAMTTATPVSGTGGGGVGGGGGGGRCVMSGTEIETLGGLPYELQVLPEYEWVRIEADDGRVLTCTLDHPLYHEDKGKVTADSLGVGDRVIMNDGVHEIVATEWVQKVCSKYQISMERGHLFYANGFLSHNLKTQNQ